jgi:hypothetical protein
MNRRALVAATTVGFLCAVPVRIDAIMRVLTVSVPSGTTAAEGADTRVVLGVNVKNDGAAKQRFYLKAEIDSVADPSRSPMYVFGPNESHIITFPLTFRASRITGAGVGIRVSVMDPDNLELASAAVTIPAAPRLSAPGPAARMAKLAPTYDIELTLDDILVRDDCDSVTDGDWMLFYSLAEYRDGAFHARTTGRYPAEGRGSFNIESGHTKPLGRTLRLGAVNQASELWLTIAAMDCDQDSPFTWPLTAPAAWGSAVSGGGDTSFATWASSCGGEEWTEVSGANDRVGSYLIRLPRDRWQRGGAFSGEPADFTPADCGRSPFTPYFRIRATER